MARLFANVALVALSLAVGLVLAEGAFRLLTGEQVELQGLYGPDPTAGIGLTPGFRGHVRTTEFAYEVRINELGMRDGPVGAKPPGTRRVLVLGDSFVFGVGVDVAESLPKALERHLAVAGLGPVEVWNAGVPGYSPFQELRMLERLAPVLEPDLVLQVIFMGDDWYGNAPRTPPAEARRRPREILAAHSALYRFVDRFVLSRLKGGDHYEAHRRDPAPAFRQRVDAVVNLVERSRAAAERAGATYLVALCPRYTQVYDDAWAKAAVVYRLDPVEYTPEQPNRAFAELLRMRDVATVDLLGPLRDEAKRRRLHFAVDGHWNREGNHFVADLLGREIVGRRLLAASAG